MCPNPSPATEEGPRTRAFFFYLAADLRTDFLPTVDEAGQVASGRRVADPPARLDYFTIAVAVKPQHSISRTGATVVPLMRSLFSTPTASARRVRKLDLPANGEVGTGDERTEPPSCLDRVTAPP